MRIVVLGGGPGGYGAAFEAARLGAQVTLIERDRLGGTCLNRGCIPTKTILRSAHIVADTRAAASFGLSAATAQVDVPALRERTSGVVAGLVAQVEGTASRLKVEVMRGTGRLIGPKTVSVDLADGGSTAVEGDAVILATGSISFELPGIDHAMDGVWTSDEAVSLTDVPDEVLIIGGGVIGLEFACAYAAFGRRVTVVELMDQVLPGNDRRVVKQVQGSLEAMGIEFVLNDAVETVERVNGRMRSTLRGGRVIESDVVMSAVGRVPDSAGLGFEEAGIGFERRAVAVDEYFRTTVPGIYAVGDLIGGMMLAHVAEEEGVVAARNAMAELRGPDAADALETVRYDCIPACVYTFPNVAVVGTTRDQAREAGIDAVQAVAKFAANGRALGEGEGDGFVQIVAEKGTGRIVGCQIVGPFAVEMIHEVALAMRRGQGVDAVAELVHAHPTASEVIRMACADAAVKCGC